MNKYEITYVEGNIINITTVIEANSISEALIVFYLENPDALHNKIVLKEGD